MRATESDRELPALLHARSITRNWYLPLTPFRLDPLDLADLEALVADEGAVIDVGHVVHDDRVGVGWTGAAGDHAPAPTSSATIMAATNTPTVV